MRHLINTVHQEHIATVIVSEPILLLVERHNGFDPVSTPTRTTARLRICRASLTLSDAQRHAELALSLYSQVLPRLYQIGNISDDL